ncbi:MAG: hypothetical protein PF542_04155 [Nanoarchaeota archaeon]|jgi:hypothetical protein|nr:hypothetical protein [Nanoarchaeota archaeon]
MFKKVSKSDEINKKLELEGRVKILDSPKDLKKINQMNEFMQEVRRDYIYKSAMSEISASNATLTASYQSAERQYSQN